MELFESNDSSPISLLNPIYRRQTSGEIAHEPDVHSTVMAQINEAKSVRGDECNADLSSLRRKLKDESALEFPPALAAICGLGTAPYRLYKSIG